MELFGFSVTLLLLILIVINKNKLNLKKIGIIVGIYFISIPLFIVLLLVLKQMDIKPDKELTITTYVAFLCVVLFTITIFLMEKMVNLILGFQIKIGNERNTFLSKIIDNKNKFLNFLKYIAFIGFCYISYVVWFIM